MRKCYFRSSWYFDTHLCDSCWDLEHENRKSVSHSNQTRKGFISALQHVYKGVTPIKDTTKRQRITDPVEEQSEIYREKNNDYERKAKLYSEYQSLLNKVVEASNEDDDCLVYLCALKDFVLQNPPFGRLFDRDYLKHKKQSKEELFEIDKDGLINTIMQAIKDLSEGGPNWIEDHDTHKHRHLTVDFKLARIMDIIHTRAMRINKLKYNRFNSIESFGCGTDYRFCRGKYMGYGVWITNYKGLDTLPSDKYEACLTSLLSTLFIGWRKTSYKECGVTDNCIVYERDEKEYTLYEKKCKHLDGFDKDDNDMLLDDEAMLIRFILGYLNESNDSCTHYDKATSKLYLWKKIQKDKPPSHVSLYSLPLD
jgi:hypothetical protein